MRIIAGEFRGRQLIEPRFDTTRPITDRAKQSLFDILSPILDDAVVYDCFCGTGSMGLECLSRGAKHATFFDADRHALAGLKKNIETLGVADRSKIVPGDIFRAFPPAAAEPSQKKDVTILFFDPPYPFLKQKPEPLLDLMQRLLAHRLVEDAVILFRHDVADAMTFPGTAQTDLRTYGGMAIEILVPAKDSANELTHSE